jgi:hypothetical protein
MQTIQLLRGADKHPDTGNNYPEQHPAAAPVFTGYVAVKSLGHKIVENVQAKTCATMIPFRGEKRLKNMFNIFIRDTFAVVAITDFYIILLLMNLDGYGAILHLLEAMDKRVYNKI